MRNHLNLISAGVSILFFCSCGSDSTGNSGGLAGQSSSSSGAGAVTAGVSGTGNGGSASNIAGSPGGGGSSNLGGAGTAGGTGGASSNSGGDTGGGGKPTGVAGSIASGGGAGGATGTGSCTRASLQAAADAYQAAQAAGDKSKMPLAPSATFTENFKATSKGIWETPLVIAYRHDLLDTEACQTFSEVYVTEGEQQYVIGVRFSAQGQPDQRDRIDRHHGHRQRQYHH
ncbi:MAG: hypothetical protein WDO74_00155 [Pseudomonadota bacterium]